MERLSTSTSLYTQNYHEFFYFRFISLSLQLNHFFPRFSFLFFFLVSFSSALLPSLYNYLSIYIEKNITSFNIDYLTNVRGIYLPAFYFWRREIRYKPIVTLIYHCISFYTLLSIKSILYRFLFSLMKGIPLITYSIP